MFKINNFLKYEINLKLINVKSDIIKFIVIIKRLLIFIYNKNKCEKMGRHI